MLSFIKRYKFQILGFLVFSAVFLSISIYLLTPNKKLPIFNPSDVNPELVDSTVQHVSKYHTIADFSFTNQNGEIITQKNYEEKIYVADFFFTTCPTICPIMQDNMVKVQNVFKDVQDVMLLSHTVMPHIDSVPVLKKYALEKGVIDSKWNLVTGDKKDIFYIARKSYLAVKTETEGELYDMVHTENFILVDKKRRVRGFYDGTNTEEINRLIEDIRFLLTEKN
ncbi:MAG TPA: SCO family protein [Flavobacterium sp.]|uniref:SCO family protein n=1 Tax=unclassified Flavobacterium TaxID=196869 RepID=UPI0025BE06EA|nr:MULTISPECIES: SCO family protein [unclassified Flavobacterium]HRE77693.1 SCO family protein [Flavobacterium sp.]